jgi:hypothetical protein
MHRLLGLGGDLWGLKNKTVSILILLPKVMRPIASHELNGWLWI